MLFSFCALLLLELHIAAFISFTTYYMLRSSWTKLPLFPFLPMFCLYCFFGSVIFFLLFLSVKSLFFSPFLSISFSLFIFLSRSVLFIIIATTQFLYRTLFTSSFYYSTSSAISPLTFSLFLSQCLFPIHSLYFFNLFHLSTLRMSQLPQKFLAQNFHLKIEKLFLSILPVYFFKVKRFF